ncbi:MAG: acyltransferase family protein [Sodaliphilus sp.]
MNANELPMKRRIEYFDILKGIAIYLVVMGHVIAMCIRGLDAALLFKIIEQVHMPIFFFVSGYFTYKASKEKTFITPGLKKRFLQLIIPFLVLTPVWFFYFPHSHLLSPICQDLPSLFCSVYKGGYWFPICLFELCVLYMPLSAILRRLRRATAQMAVLIATYSVLIVLTALFANRQADMDCAGLILLTRLFPAFAIGVMVHHLREGFKALLQRRHTFSIALFTFAICFYCVAYPWDIWGQDLSFLWTPVSLILSPILHFSLFIIAITLVKPWSEKEFAPEAKPSVVARYFRLLGNESLGIYLLHYFFLFPLTMLQAPFKEMGLALVPLSVTAIAVAFCIIAITLFVIHIIKKSKIASQLLLGTPYKK